MKVQNTTEEVIDAGEFVFAPEQVIDVIEKVALELVQVKGLELVKAKKPKKAKK
jgi:hypothetical protein